MAAEFKQTSEQKFLGLYGSSVGFMAAPAEEYLDYACKNAKHQSAPWSDFPSPLAVSHVWRPG